MSKQYKFNKFGVCENPDTERVLGKGGSCCVEIRTAATDKGKWTWGVFFMLTDRGGAFGCNLCNKDWTRTQAEAKEHAISWAKKWLAEQAGDVSVVKKAKELLKGLENLNPKENHMPIQLELFNF